MAQQNQAPHTGWQSPAASDHLMPPAKRQRLSPNPGSPSTPSTGTTFPTFGMLAPVQRQSSFNTPQSVNGTSDNVSRSAVGAMGPPSRPPEKEDTRATDLRTLFDMASGVGIDEKEEEQYLMSSVRNQSDVSFNTQSSQTISPSNSFDVVNQIRVNGISLPGSGHFSQSMSQESIEDELYQRHKKAARALSERQQYHLEDPFLWGQSVRGRVQRIATENGVKIPVEGLFDKIPEKPQNVQGSTATGGNNAILELKAPSILNRGAPLEAILTLISLAANERLRGLVEDAFGLAIGRQMGSDGVIPAEWSDLAVSPVNGKACAHHSPNSSATQPHYQSQPYQLARPNALSRSLQTLSKQDRQAEEARERKRRERRVRKSSHSASQTPGLEASVAPVEQPPVNGVSTPTSVDRALNDVKMTKKERDRLAKADQTDEVLRRNANMTAKLQLGGGKQYSWLTGSKGGSGASTPNRPRIGNSAIGAANGVPAAAASATSSGGAGKEKKVGQWREDGEGGKGIQLRDWASVLEADGRDRKALAWAMARMDAESEVKAERRD